MFRICIAFETQTGLKGEYYPLTVKFTASLSIYLLIYFCIKLTIFHFDVHLTSTSVISVLKFCYSTEKARNAGDIYLK